MRMIVLFCVVLMAIFAPPTAVGETQSSGTVGLRIDFPRLVILNYSDRIALEIGSEVWDHLGKDPQSPTWLRLANAWMVRSVGGGSGGETRLSIALTENTTMSGSNGGTIQIRDVAIRTRGGSFDAFASFPPTGLGGQKVGDFELELDLRDTEDPGLYFGTGAQFVITVTNT